jgi:hypothetical protein
MNGKACALAMLIKPTQAAMAVAFIEFDNLIEATPSPR